ncbi:MAG: acetamidase/formamidase family protein [bacterium]|nr:acetamidase/formamidase family protein [bacterium]
MAEYNLKSTRDTVHYKGFTSSLKPVLFINSGDIVNVETYTEVDFYKKAPDEFITSELKDIASNLSSDKISKDSPHLLLGPIFIHDAEPENVLEVRLHNIYPSQPIGFNMIYPSIGPIPYDSCDHKLRNISLDLKKNTAEFPAESGIQIQLSPFFGVMGTATGKEKRSSLPPGYFGGNLDNKELISGSKLFLPVTVKGGLFSIGDGHAAQGDGEVNTTAIEAAMNGKLEFIVHKKKLLNKAPIAETNTDWITMGFGKTLDEAFGMALLEMVEFMKRFIGLNHTDAYSLCSLVVNFRITQVVNIPSKGVHALLPKSTLQTPIQFE